MWRDLPKEISLVQYSQNMQIRLLPDSLNIISYETTKLIWAKVGAYMISHKA